ncbi:MAG: hypothetical protein AAGA76_04990 [Pseudomonadota bacterium]
MKKTLAAIVLVASTSFTVAQDRLGVAFVQAPEVSTGHCFAENPIKAFACARSSCAIEGIAESECLRVKWCYPAGWSADIFLQHKEGVHWHQFLCGWSSREDLQAAAKLMCEGSQKEWLIECAMVGLWNPEGKEQSLNQTAQ